MDTRINNPRARQPSRGEVTASTMPSPISSSISSLRGVHHGPAPQAYRPTGPFPNHYSLDGSTLNGEDVHRPVPRTYMPPGPFPNIYSLDGSTLNEDDDRDPEYRQGPPIPFEPLRRAPQPLRAHPAIPTGLQGINEALERREDARFRAENEAAIREVEAQNLHLDGRLLEVEEMALRHDEELRGIYEHAVEHDRSIKNASRAFRMVERDMDLHMGHINSLYDDTGRMRTVAERQTEEVLDTLQANDGAGRRQVAGLEENLRGVQGRLAAQAEEMGRLRRATRIQYRFFFCVVFALFVLMLVAVFR